MKSSKELLTPTMEPEKYLKKLNSYRNRIIIHTAILAIAQIIYTVTVGKTFISFSIAGLILIDELWRLGIISRFFKGIYNSGDVIYVDSSGNRTSQNDTVALIAIVVGILLNYAMGFGVAIYFMLFEGVRLALATYKAKKVYGLEINQMVYYIIAFAFSIGAQILRNLLPLLF